MLEKQLQLISSLFHCPEIHIFPLLLAWQTRDQTGFCHTQVKPSSSCLHINIIFPHEAPFLLQCVEKEQHLQLSRKKNKRAAVLGLSNKMSEFISIKVLAKLHVVQIKHENVLDDKG